MKRTGFSLIAACIISVLIASSASASRGGGHSAAMMNGGRALIIIKALDLDDNQAKEVKAILFKLSKEMIRKKADIQVAKIELREILDNEDVNIKAAETKVKQIASLKADAAMMRIQGTEDIKARLTPEQKKKFSKMIEMRRMWHAKKQRMSWLLRKDIQGGRRDYPSHHPEECLN